MRCEIQWVDDDGKPTPDENEAIGHAWRVAYVGQYSGRGVKHEESKHYPVCAAHRARMIADEKDDPEGAKHWRFEPLASAQEGQED